ncbi:MAG: D-alanyl-D-alanine carboxypeptidase [Sulfobacillus thermosulfidooxidans]|uniref:D-alanyl-D-alanine carboxypeptidase n=1 Tax=Sulfobacillus thermosulfidooxidans TaxID=28034 RepID=A0A2T2WW70_SULTH|nr:MAG: D-alanyl-D-alanine carboxypeptidase [Sulfobacillus thermosulfidooxidans]
MRVMRKQRRLDRNSALPRWLWLGILTTMVVGTGTVALTPPLAQVKQITPSLQVPKIFHLPRVPSLWHTLAGSCEIQVAGGPILFQKNAYLERPIASTTKIMTAYLTLEDKMMPLNRKVTITSQEVLNDRQGLLKADSEVPLSRGQVVSVQDLLWALMLPSADDAAWVLARAATDNHPARFIAAMNQQARQFHMDHTHYVDPDGVNHEGYSTAADLMILTQHVMKNPEFRLLVRTKTHKTAFGVLSNLNQLLWSYPGAIGVKTGWTPWAGSCLVFGATRVEHGSPLTVYGVVLGEPAFNPMFHDTAQLLNTAFHTSWSPLIHAGQTVLVLHIQRVLTTTTLALYAAKPLGAYDVGEDATLQWRLKKPGPAWHAGQILGYARINAKGWPESSWVPLKARTSYVMPWWAHL